MSFLPINVTRSLTSLRTKLKLQSSKTSALQRGLIQKALWFPSLLSTLRPPSNPAPEKSEYKRNSDQYPFYQDWQAIQLADIHYDKGEYLEAYELLNRAQFAHNIDVLWRLCRVLYKLSRQESTPKCVRVNMVEESYEHVNHALSMDQDDCRLHVWKAVLLYVKTETESPRSKLVSLKAVKGNLERALQLCPDNISILHLYGNLCYQISCLTTFQKWLAKVLHGSFPPETTYEEALHYLLKAETLRPRFSLSNVYLLGMVCLRLKKRYSAKRYLDIAASMAPQTMEEVEFKKYAIEVGDRLKYYHCTA